jgi:glycogen debranching enzyme
MKPFTRWRPARIVLTVHDYHHNGSVWPHDTALAAVGMARYRLVESFMVLATALFDAVQHFDGARLPELFCGFSRAAGHGPAWYPARRRRGRPASSSIW